MPKNNTNLLKEAEDFALMINECVDKPSMFAKVFLGFDTYEYNKPYVDCMDRFIIARQSRQSGKTISTSTKAIHYGFFAPLLHPKVNERNECVILIVAPTLPQSKIMFGHVKNAFHKSGILDDYLVRETSDELWFRFCDDSGVAKIIVRPAGEEGTSLRGYSPHVIIIDESAYIKESIITALMPAGSATQARFWLISTPAGKSGFFYRAHSQANKRYYNGKLVHDEPRTMDMKWTEFHVNTDDMTDIERDKELLKEIEFMTKDKYRQEIHAEFLDVGNALIPFELIKESLNSNYELPGNCDYYLGVDISRMGGDETVYLDIAVDNKSNAYVTNIETESFSDLTDIAERIYKKNKSRFYKEIFIDSTGLGAGVYDICKKKNLDTDVYMPIVDVNFRSEKEIIYTNLTLLFERKKIFIKGWEKLAYQLQYLTKDHGKDGDSAHMKIKSEEHDDLPDGLALACKRVYGGGEVKLLPPLPRSFL